MGTAGIEGDADDAFELVSRPTRPGAAAAPLPAKPARRSADEVGCCWLLASCCLGWGAAGCLLLRAAVRGRFMHTSR